MTERERLERCLGCDNNFYNDNNPYGVKRCWSLKDMKIIWRKRVGLWQTPPWNQKPVRKPSCYHEKGQVYVGPKVRY